MHEQELKTIVYDDPISTEEKTVTQTLEVEVLPPDDETEKRLAEIENQLSVLDANIDKLTSHADNLDYAVAIASGIICGLVDIFFVGNFDFQEGREWSTEKINEFVKNIAQKQGYEGDDLAGAIRYLEKFGAPSDSVYTAFGGARQHHLRDFAHHASPIGLVFSLLTQFTKKAYGTNTLGAFIVVPIEDCTFIGDNFYTKIMFGLIYWMLHMASDMAGSKNTPGGGTGVPGPVVSIVKLFSSLPIFKHENGVNELSKTISKLFNGTLLAERDSIGKIAKDLAGKPMINQMDLRGELGVAYEIGKQAIPVLMNEAFVRGFYFLNRLIDELTIKKHLRDVDWQKTIPFGNRTIERMMTIASGTFFAVDAIDALIEGAVKSKGNAGAFGKEVVLRLNFVGVGRFTVALGTEAVMEFRKRKDDKQRMLLKNETLCLMNVKVYQGEVLLWQANRDAEMSVNGFYDALKTASADIIADVQATEQCVVEIDALNAEKIEENNPGLLQDLLDEI